MTIDKTMRSQLAGVEYGVIGRCFLEVRRRVRPMTLLANPEEP